MTVNTISLERQVAELKQLLSSLEQASTLHDKLEILNALPIVQTYLQTPSPVCIFLKGLTPECDYAIKSIIAIGQAPIVFNTHNTQEDRFEKLRQLLEQVLDVEKFYQHIGGIIGYHAIMLSLIINQQKASVPAFDHTCYTHPEGFYVGEDNLEVRQAVRWGIENIKNVAEMYPVGGSGDRLNLIDEKTGVPLPAATLAFLGRTLLEGLIRDVQAYEYLAYKLLREQFVTPIAMMTSVEKDNHRHVINICKEHKWFGRPSESFYFFIQPSVPVITIEGNWSLKAPLTLTLKPSGHGVIWKLAEEQAIFTWFESMKRTQCVIRQINNPLAGIDNSILALIGIGSHQYKVFGFVSCERLLNSAEGTNVLIETQTENGYAYCLTNIEYTTFNQKGIGEIPAEPGSLFSTYPANTNILFVDISAIRQIVKACSIPGHMINMKSKVPYIDPQGNQSFVPGGRLESTMQNIADYLVDYFPKQIDKDERKNNLKTFIVYNKRIKTISTTKQSYQPGESPVSTPEQAYYDLLSNNYSLLQQCQFELPSWETIEEYLQKGPICIFLFHPALGPLYSIIKQKIRKGSLHPGAELVLEVVEVDIEDLEVHGSLLIEAVSPLGVTDATGFLRYEHVSCCTLRHVKISNRGINFTNTKRYWKNEIVRHEAVTIKLHEGAEFYAENITLNGNHFFEVPAYHRLILRASTKGQWVENLQPIAKPTWQWEYAFDTEDRILLTKSDNSQ